MPSNISSFVVPFFSWLQSFPESGSFLISQLFASGRHSIGTSPSASVLPMNIQDWLVWSCRPRDSQESSPTPLFKSINSLTLSLLYGPTLTAIHDYWKNHSFEYTDICWQNDVWGMHTCPCSVAQSCLTLCDPMDCSTPGFPVLHQLPELAQTQVHWVGDVIQQTHPLFTPPPPAFNLSQDQGLF